VPLAGVPCVSNWSQEDLDRCPQGVVCFAKAFGGLVTICRTHSPIAKQLETSGVELNLLQLAQRQKYYGWHRRLPRAVVPHLAVIDSELARGLALRQVERGELLAD
jgi:hypothetical protein